MIGTPDATELSGLAASSVDAILAKAGRENFPVATRLFPRWMRPHLMAIYGFARLADDIGDEAPGDRLALLDRLEVELRSAYQGETTDPLLRRLAATIRTRSLPPEPFARLIEANRQDQRVTRYRTFDELLGYCALSANPVGELVLRVAGLWTPERAPLSDATCTGLQLVELWQDLGEDLDRGRVYLPLEDLDRFGYSLEDLAARVVDDRFRALMAFEVDRTRALLVTGRVLARTLPGRIGLAVRLFTAGGMAALDDLVHRGFDTLRSSAHASRARRAAAGVRELVRT
jgi:squalene synthase HpnC